MFSSALIFTFTLLFLAIGAMICCSRFGETLFPLCRDLSKKAMDFLADLTGKLPFALWEVLVAILVVLFLWTLLRVILKRTPFLPWFGWILRLSALAFFLFVFLWGLNHYAPPISGTLGLTIRDSTEEELTAATKYYMDMAEYYAEQMNRNEDGSLAERDFDELAALAGESFTALGEQYPLFRCSSAPVKKAVLTRLVFDYTGTTGLFVCFTGESTVSPDTYAASLPHTMCHEVAHRCGIAGEDEANFAAFLACIQNEDLRMQYSGWYSAFLYCYNALYKENKSAALALWTEDNALLRADCHGANEHYAQYEGKVQDAATKVNDTYLKAFSEESGVQSYGEAADYLIAWYLREA